MTSYGFAASHSSPPRPNKNQFLLDGTNNIAITHAESNMKQLLLATTLLNGNVQLCNTAFARSKLGWRQAYRTRKNPIRPSSSMSPVFSYFMSQSTIRRCSFVLSEPSDVQLMTTRMPPNAVRAMFQRQVIHQPYVLFRSDVPVFV